MLWVMEEVKKYLIREINFRKTESSRDFGFQKSVKIFSVRVAKVGLEILKITGCHFAIGLSGQV